MKKTEGEMGLKEENKSTRNEKWFK